MTESEPTKPAAPSCFWNIASLNRKGFTLVEIMIVVAIIALLAAIAVPGFLRAQAPPRASRILNDLPGTLLLTRLAAIHHRELQQRSPEIIDALRRI
jgi:prepilin-type N-terminal cleavage/methylation domain-containing protein